MRKKTKQWLVVLIILILLIIVTDLLIEKYNIRLASNSVENINYRSK